MRVIEKVFPQFIRFLQLEFVKTQYGGADIFYFRFISKL